MNADWPTSFQTFYIERKMKKAQKEGEGNLSVSVPDFISTLDQCENVIDTSHSYLFQTNDLGRAQKTENPTNLILINLYEPGQLDCRLLKHSTSPYHSANQKPTRQIFH